MLIVLAVCALLTVLALPMLGNLGASLRFRFARDGIERQIDSLATTAFAQSRAMRIGGADGVVLDLPRGWTAEVPRPIDIRADGACSGGELFVQAGDTRFHYRLDAPRCHPVLVP
ncbi:hypothetical protein TMPK1_40270 [Rhodospirillales bacterium TMPK1]|uniref:Uncharacterized protein n=2 Tax=Roseiterribacter gracilis TaxID=2812848 RepID=A0A8S8XLV5_9PROT|nr:hypothetical protein TMPK1_40270 [Rhodospirillales bacterium TMPK1]